MRSELDGVIAALKESATAGVPGLFGEAWSDAARAASIAARRSKAKGGDWRKAARSTFIRTTLKTKGAAAARGLRFNRPATDDTSGVHRPGQNIFATTVPNPYVTRHDVSMASRKGGRYDRWGNIGGFYTSMSSHRRGARFRGIRVRGISK